MAQQKVIRKLKCPHCGNLAPMEVRSSFDDLQVSEEDEGYSFEYGTIYEVMKCPACSEVIIRRYYLHEGVDDEHEIEFEMLYPLTRGVPLGLPPAILKGLEASEKVKKVDANAYGVLVRRVLEMVCIDRKAKGRSLFNKLTDLSKSGEIPEKLVDVAHHLKDFGNVGAHAGLGELTTAEVPILDDLCRAILEYVYGAPFLVQKAQNSLGAIKK